MRKKIAVISTVFYPASHTDVIVGRWLYPGRNDAERGFISGRSELASLYVVETPPDPVTNWPQEEWINLAGKGNIDMSGFVSETFSLPLYPTIREALTLGGDSLAVDGVILIGEHGTYSFNALGQKLYPRYELFREIVKVFDECGVSVPVFNDKHYSYDIGKAKEMVALAADRGFLFFGGSSAPYMPSHPPLDGLEGAPITDAVVIYSGNFKGDREAYGYHSYETGLAFVENRAGGETGIASVTAWEGDALWNQFDSGIMPLALLEAAALAANRYEPSDYRRRCADSGRVVDGVTFVHKDGLRVTHINMAGHSEQPALALRLAGGSIRSTWLEYGTAEGHYEHFAALARVIEDGILTGNSPFPPERVLLSTCATAYAQRAYAAPDVSLATPELAIAYNCA